MNDYRYLTLEQIVENENYPFTRGQIRALLLARHKNGLSKSVRKIGKRLYIRKDLFDEWIESQQDGE